MYKVIDALGVNIIILISILCGLIPACVVLAYGLRLKLKRMAIASFVITLIIGFLTGMLGALPCCLLCCYLLYSKHKQMR